MTLANTQINFIRTDPIGNNGDRTAVPVVVGTCSSGPINEITPIYRFSDLTTFGMGELVELAASILNNADSPVPIYVCRSLTSTSSTIGSITKTYGNPVGTPIISYGSVMVPGADANGDVLITPKSLLATIVILNPGVLTPATLVVTVGNSVTVTLKHDGTNITENGTGLTSAINGNAPAFALLSATAQGTGASVVGTLASNTLTDNYLNITAISPGISYRVLVSGNNTPFSTSFLAGVITVNCATNATGEPTSTMATTFASLQALALANPGKFSVASVGVAGVKIIAAKSITILPFGSTGTITASGIPGDKMDFIVQIVEAGTIGGPIPVTVIWSPDAGFSYSSRAKGIISPSGIFSLDGTNMPTGVTITLTGSFDVGDKFTFSTTRPISSSTDFIAAIDACLAQTTYTFGYFTSCTSVDKNLAVLIDGRLQTSFNKKFLYAILNARDIGEGVPGETLDQWKNSLKSDFASFISFVGCTAIVDTWIQFLSSYTLRSIRIAGVCKVSAQNSSFPMYENLMFTNSNYSTNSSVLKTYHDEYLSPGMDDYRFITLRTYDESPTVNSIYTTDGNTFGDPLDSSSERLHWNRMRLSVGYNVKRSLFKRLGSRLQTINIKESLSVPVGALTVDSANKVSTEVKNIMKEVLGPTGAIDMSTIIVDVPRNYNLFATKTLIVNGSFTPFGDVKKIRFNLALNIA